MILNDGLVGGWATPLKNMISSVGMMTFPIYGKIKGIFQTTNQIIYIQKGDMITPHNTPFYQWKHPIVALQAFLSVHVVDYVPLCLAALQLCCLDLSLKVEYQKVWW